MSALTGELSSDANSVGSHAATAGFFGSLAAGEVTRQAARCRGDVFSVQLA